MVKDKFEAFASQSAQPLHDSHRSGLRLCMNFSSAILAPSHTSRRSVFANFFFINWCHRSATLHTRQRRARKSFCFLCTTLAKKEALQLALGLVDRQAELSENNKADRLEEMTTLHILRFKAATSERREKTESQAVDEPWTTCFGAVPLLKLRKWPRI